MGYEDPHSILLDGLGHGSRGFTHTIPGCGADGLSLQVLAVDLLNPSPAAEAKKHKLKTLVPAPRSFFMDVKCPGCFTITTVFSHAQTVVICQGCTTVLCQPTGGKARLTEGCSFRRK
ncbi:putative Ribosomal protein S27-domain-containing protein [Seiridium cardinale]|uniref:Ribosomal protein S27-domain-containing protein n=1 Tax=Seiridium cardinale TaxID=138064 RepID=A0ABR2XNE0_9PEZI